MLNKKNSCNHNFKLPSLTALCHQTVFNFLEALLLESKNTNSCAHNLADNLPKPSRLLLLDATAGNGRDTLFLAQALESLAASSDIIVHAFDVQAEAIKKTQKRLEAESLGQRLKTYLESHEHLASFLPEPDAIAIAMFNLGFLPRSNKELITKKASTLLALKSLCGLNYADLSPNEKLAGAALPEAKVLLALGGLLAVHCYAGHAGGELETEAVLDFCNQLDSSKWRVLQTELISKKQNRELLFLVERLL